MLASKEDTTSPNSAAIESFKLSGYYKPHRNPEKIAHQSCSLKLLA